MDIKLIAFDLDGTLLRPDKTISPRTQAALEAANAKGVLLVPATGRLFIALPPELQDAALVRYMILINGASIYDSKTKQILTRTEMDLPQAERMHAYMQTLPALCGFYALRFGSDVYRFIFAARQKSTESERNARETVHSFRRLTLDEIQAARPLRIKVITVQPGDTVESLSHRMAGVDHPAERFRVLNGLDRTAHGAPRSSGLVARLV